MAEELLSTTRNGVVERRERGHCCLSDADGNVVWHVGDLEHVTYMRSSAKPMQATVLVLSGAQERFGLETAQIAVACGSHNGEEGHVRAAATMLSRAGVPNEALQCGTHEPWPPESRRLAEAGLTPTPLHNNCSGKHSGMLAAAQAMGAPLASYLDPAHPVQQAIRTNLAACAGIPEEELQAGVDGCSAPNYALPIRVIARCFARVARPESLPAPLAGALTRVAAAMRAYPWLVDGTDGLDTILMAEATTPLVSKGGAEGLQCVAIPSLGLGLAVKFESGRADRIGTVVIAILRGLGVLEEALPAGLARFDRPPVCNHRGTRVGETQVLLTAPSLERLARLGRV